jgi:hypothetical protein
VKHLKPPAYRAETRGLHATFTFRREKGGAEMGPEVYLIVGLSIIDLFWWLKK